MNWGLMFGRQIVRSSVIGQWKEPIMFYRLPVALYLWIHLTPAGVSGTELDLQVCMAHSDQTGQLECCAEFGIEESNCSAPDDQASSAPATSQPDYRFFCNTRDVDGSGEDINKWGKGTDFQFVAEKNIWEWRTKYSVRSIDASGGFYETSMIRNGTDRVGECGPEIQWQYEK